VSIDREALAELAFDERKLLLCRPPTIVGAAAIIKAAATRTAFLIQDRIPARAITFIVGAPGEAKSWLAYSLAIAVMHGTPWLGCDNTTSPGPALFLNYDNPTPELGRRMLRLGLDPTDPAFFHSVEVNPLQLPEAHEDLLAIVDNLKPVITVVDSFRQAHVSNENDSGEMAIVMRAMKALTSRGSAVVIVHHASKSLEAQGAAKARGAGEIIASADAAIMVANSVASWEKVRSWQLPDIEAAIPFRLVDRGDRTYVEVV
jgi:RecA-family ATPase